MEGKYGQERTTTTAGGVDMSADQRGTSSSPASRERALFDAYRGAARRTEPCACGEDIVAIPQWEEAAVWEHNAGRKHQAWRAWREAE